MRRLAPLALVLAAVTLAGAACGSSGPAGPERHRAPGLALSLQTPGGWKAVSAADVLKPKFVENLRDENPALAEAIAPLAQADSPVLMMVVDPHIEKSFATNIVVGKEPIPATATLAEYADAVAASIRRGGLTQTVDRTTVKLPSGRSVRLRYGVKVPSKGGDGPVTATEQYLFVRDATGYVVTFTTISDLRSKYEPIFATSARSIEFE